MRAKPEMKPWVHTDKSRMSSVGAALSAQVFALRLGSAAPFGGSINVYQCLTQGLRPGLGRSIALAGLMHVFPTNPLLGSFDVLALAFSLIKCFIIWVRWFVDYV